MKRATMIGLLLVALVGVNVSSSAQFYPVKELEREKLSARPGPTAVSKESGDALRGKGYVIIGEVGRTEKGKRCWGANCEASLDCSSEFAKKDLTRDLLDKAAAAGGDVVTLSADNTIVKDTDTKQGKCTGKISVRKLMPVQRCTSAGRDSTGTYRTGTCTSDLRWMDVKECVSWETLHGSVCSIRTEGKVWRLDPDLAGSIIERRERAAAEAKAAAEEAERDARAKAEKEAFRLKSHAFIATADQPAGSLTPYKEGGKWGYRDESGRAVIAPRFESALPFTEGLAAITTGNKLGFIDSTGALAIEAKFDEGYEFSEGLAVVGYCKSRGKSHRCQMGYIDKKAGFVIPLQFGWAKSFSDGLAAAATDDFYAFDKNAWGFIDKSGRWVIRPGYLYAHGFSEGLAPVGVGTVKSHRWGYINREGVFVIQPTFEYADMFCEGLAMVELQGKYGYINRSGELVIHPQFEKATAFKNGVARVVFGNTVGFVDKSGKVTPAQ